MEFKEGFFEGIPNKEYHNGPGYSRSDLVLAKDYSPAHVKAKEALIETPAMIFGSAAHMACLEADLFPQRYSVMPEGLNLRTKDGKAFKEMAEKKDKILLSTSDGEKIFAMQKKLLAHPTAKKYLHGGQFEISGFFRDPDYGLPCKVRYDYLIMGNDRPIIVDYKTSADPRERPFTNMAFNHRYHVQAAFYSFGLTCINENVSFHDVDFVFIVQEKTPPYEIIVYSAEEDYKREGMQFCETALQILKKCEDSGEWPGYQTYIEPLDLPEWRKRQIEKGIYE